MDTPILLVEDSATDANIMVTAFRGVGYGGDIKIAKDGVQALDWLAQQLSGRVTAQHICDF